MNETVQLELANQRKRLGDELSKLDEEVKAWLRYQQGCRCRYRSNILDALDATHTLIQKVIIPRGVIAINSVKLSAYGHKFRAYESGAAAGGAEYVTSDPSTMSVTTDSGTRDKTDLTTPANTDTSQPTPSETGYESGHTHRVVWNYTTSTYSKMYVDPSVPKLYSDSADAMELKAQTYTSEGDVNHQHGCDHTHQAQGATHQHAMDHTHQVPGSSHSHDVELQNHTHNLIFAIYEAASASAAISLTIKDPAGNDHNIGSLGSGEFSKENLELKEYFTMIGVYTFTFSADGLGRITSIVVCDLVIEPE